jgi:hypothetical protein
MPDVAVLTLFNVLQQRHNSHHDTPARMSQQRNRSLSHGSASHKGSNNNGNVATNNSNSNNVPSNTHTSNSGASTPAKKVTTTHAKYYMCASL